MTPGVRDHVVHLGINVSHSDHNCGWWSMVLMLWQQFEHDYYFAILLCM